MKVNLGDLAITSAAFAHGDRIPEQHSADGAATSPPLSWTNVPEGTRSFALVCDDPDAPLNRGFCHWVLYGIPADVRGLEAGGGTEYTQGVNGMDAAGWTAPSPPPGHGEHFYYFHLYAVGDGEDLEPGLSKDALLDAIDERIIEQARIVGTYGRG